MKTARKVLIILLLVGVMAALALLLAGVAVGAAVEAAGGSQELAKDLVMDLVVSNVDDHPPIDAIVEKIPNDCQECHNDRHYHQENSQ